jgi:hypothetical protein
MAWSVDLDSGVGQSSSPPVSTDNTCGPQNGEVCPAGQCCSGSGVSWLHQYRDGPLLIFNLQYCGNGEPYCGAGCYSGNCVTGSVSQTFAPTVGQTTLSNLHGLNRLQRTVPVASGIHPCPAAVATRAAARPRAIVGPALCTATKIGKRDSMVLLVRDRPRTLVSACSTPV